MDQRFDRLGFDVRVVRLPPWKIWLLTAVGGAVALALTLAVAGLFLILVPLLLLGGLAARFLLRGATAPVAGRPRGAPGVIEAQYEVLEPPVDGSRR